MGTAGRFDSFPPRHLVFQGILNWAVRDGLFNLVTVDDFRALNHAYWPHPAKSWQGSMRPASPAPGRRGLVFPVV
ncbi:hypothetical protein GCM10017653_35450 [Ancylobacter defluvii]|uniref:Uncharacterized protein n=1 Tax=Ancylobacter defluvii TaxID=1282440 RepID=A0A9W6K0H1_9HYPH|nr:hypothetical protein GCM10017653_35450 [Ancylobacter defluvii]